MGPKGGLVSGAYACAWCGADFGAHEEPRLRLVALLADDGTPLRPKLLHVHEHCAPAIDPWREQRHDPHCERSA
jgi:hypothetical protein